MQEKVVTGSGNIAESYYFYVNNPFQGCVTKTDINLMGFSTSQHIKRRDMKKIFIILPVSIAFLVFACKQAGNNGSDQDSLLSDTSLEGQESKVMMIYYDSPSPLEMATLIHRDKASFYPELLSPTENADRLATVSELALNLGIFGVDFSYAKLFDHNQEALKYLSAIEQLSQKLDIPRDQATSVFKDLESSVEDNDSLLIIINDVFITAVEHLRETDRSNVATLMILGGWIEALYIALHVYEREDKPQEILERIAAQKLSLNNLVQLVSASQEDPKVAEFLEELVALKKVYDKVELDFTGREVENDKERGVYIVKGDAPFHTKLTDEDTRKMKQLVNLLRSIILR